MDCPKPDIALPASQLPGHRWKRRFCILFICLLGIAGGYWWFWAHTLKLVEEYPLHTLQNTAATMCVAQDGLLLEDDGLIFRDWTGRIRWQIPFGSAGAPFDPFYVASPDGHVVGALDFTHEQTLRCRVTTWRDGHEIGQVEMPFPGIYNPDMMVLDNGQVLITAEQDQSLSFTLIAGKQIIATGRYLFHHKVPSQVWFRIATDASCLVVGSQYLWTGFEYASLRVDGRNVRATYRYYAACKPTGDYPTPTLCENGVALGQDGTLFNRYGPRPGAGGDNPLFTPLYGNHVALRQKGTVRIVTLPAGRTLWTLPTAGRGEPQLFCCSPNGRYAVQIRPAHLFFADSINRIYAWLRSHAGRTASMPQLLSENFLAISLYAQPGHLLARKMLPADTYYSNVKMHGKWYQVTACIPSPDGRHIIVCAGSNVYTAQSQAQALVWVFSR